MAEDRTRVEFDENKRQARLRNDQKMMQELGKEHQQDHQRRGLSPSQEALPTLPFRRRPSFDTQYSADSEDEAEEVKLQARLAKKERKRAEIVKEIARLGLTEQITLPAINTQSPSTSHPSAAKTKLTGPPKADIARDAQGGTRKLRKKRGLPSLLAPKPEVPGKEEFLKSPLNQLKKENLGSKTKGAFHRLKRTLSPSSTSVRTEPPGTDPSVVDTQKKIELAREARRNLVAAAKYSEAPPRSSSLGSHCSKEFPAATSTPADLERKMEIAKVAQKKLEAANAHYAASSDTTQAFPLCSTRNEFSVSEIVMKPETQKKIELAREAEWEKVHGTLPDESSAFPKTLPTADSEYGLHSLEFDHVSDTQKKIGLAREVRRKLEEGKAKGIPPTLPSTPMLECKHWLRCDL